MLSIVWTGSCLQSFGNRENLFGNRKEIDGPVLMPLIGKGTQPCFFIVQGEVAPEI